VVLSIPPPLTRYLPLMAFINGVRPLINGVSNTRLPSFPVPQTPFQSSRSFMLPASATTTTLRKSNERRSLPLFAPIRSRQTDSCRNGSGVSRCPLSPPLFAVGMSIASMKLAKGNVRSGSPRRVSRRVSLLSFDASLLSSNFLVAVVGSDISGYDLSTLTRPMQPKRGEDGGDQEKWC